MLYEFQHPYALHCHLSDTQIHIKMANNKKLSNEVITSLKISRIKKKSYKNRPTVRTMPRQIHPLTFNFD